MTNVVGIQSLQGRNSTKYTLIVITCFSVIQAVSAFYNDYSNSKDYPGVELRQQVVAARLLDFEYSSYYFTWRNGMPEELLIPGPVPIRWTTTVAPSVLMIKSLYADYRYPIVRMITFLMSYAMLAAIIISFLLVASSPEKKLLVLIVGLLFIACSPAWSFILSAA